MLFVQLTTPPTVTSMVDHLGDEEADDLVTIHLRDTHTQGMVNISGTYDEVHEFVRRLTSHMALITSHRLATSDIVTLGTLQIPGFDDA